MYKKGTKTIASMLVFIMMFAYLNIVGQVFAVSLEAQNSQTNHPNVEFDSYFIVNKNKTHTTMQTIGEENYLYAKIKVKDIGYLKNACITTENANFKMLMTQNSNISKVEENKITLNQINNGDTQEIAIPIQILENSSIEEKELKKESTIKLTGIYIDKNGKEKKIEKEITVSLVWTAQKEAQLDMQIARFIPYNKNEEKGIVLQTIVQSYLKDNLLPIKENKIEISVPTMNNVKPTEVKVTANTTKATNGDETGLHFTQENYSYDVETSKLTIVVENRANQEGKFSWQKQAQDEFIVTYIYPETTIPAEGIKLSISANTELTMLETNQEKVQKSFEGEVTLKEPISKLVEFTLETTKELSKGQMYANMQTDQKIETEYKETWTANVGLAELTDKIILEGKENNFITEKNTKLNAENETYYKTIALEKENFDKLLGQEGEIDLYVGTTLISKINKETEANEQGKLEVDVTEYNTNHLTLETSKPQTEGNITFDVTKAIIPSSAYSTKQLKNVNSLEVNLQGIASTDDRNVVEETISKPISLNEPSSQAELLINNPNLSTVKVNENVKFTAVLKTDSLDCMLFKNPTLQIILPSYIDNINIKNVKVLFDTEASKLTLKSHQVVPNKDGTKSILISLEGTQTEYTLGSVSKGINVVITSDITVNKFTANKQDQIKMIYTNEMAKSASQSAETKETSATLNIVAPVGVITTSTISNYAQNAQNVTSISGEEQTAILEILTEAKNPTLSMEVINNYNNEIDNISILGRTLFKGNKNIITSNDLGSTMNVPLTTPIQVSGVPNDKVAIYYSENENATKDLNLEQNAWTLTPANLANVKSYLIVLTNHTMNTADKISFNYNAQIPANLPHNQSAYENYVVYFNNHLEAGTIEDKQASTKIGVTTGRGPELEATITSNIPETEEVLSGRFIKYTITVKNIGKEVADNVVASVNLPRNLTHIEFVEGETGEYTQDTTKQQLTFELGSLKSNQTITRDFWTVVKDLELQDICKDESHYITDSENTKIHLDDKYIHKPSEYKAEVSLEASISATRLAKPIKSNTVKNTITRAAFDIETYLTDLEENLINEETLDEETEYQYVIKVALDNEFQRITAQNTVLKVAIPDGAEYKNTEIEEYSYQDGTKTKTEGIEYDKNARMLTINLGDVTTASKNKTIKITMKTNKLEGKEYKKVLTHIAKVSADDYAEEVSEEETVIYGKVALTIAQTSNIQDGQKISTGDKISYKITVENIGGKPAKNMTIKDVLPKELQFVQGKYKIKDYENYISIDENNTIHVDMTLEVNETLEMSIDAVAREVSEDTKITNFAQIEEYRMESNKISYTIEKTEYTEITNPTSQTRKLTGLVWIDENGDGIREDSEKKLAGIPVMLYNNKTNTLVSNTEGKVISVTTDEDGVYTFKNIPQGSYTVIFLYDTANYSATTYRATSATTENNSDAVDSKITLDGVTRMVAITEQIIITDNNIYNIDLGLVSNPKFDLKLDKTVTSITVQDSNGTKKYEYNDTKLAKKDLVGKEISNTTIIVEYKIKVTNEGAISGYVKKIADYMPSEMKFNSELNKDWYTSGNGTLYNASLANTLINPGESKEVTLLLTKKMTEDNLGLYNNTAEIYEAYNDLGIADIDSTAGNKVSSEDDMSSADVLITVKTGEALLFVGLSITIIAIIGISAYVIQKKVLR